MCCSVEHKTHNIQEVGRSVDSFRQLLRLDVEVISQAQRTCQQEAEQLENLNVKLREDVANRFLAMNAMKAAVIRFVENDAETLL